MSIPRDLEVLYWAFGYAFFPVIYVLRAGGNVNIANGGQVAVIYCVLLRACEASLLVYFAFIPLSILRAANHLVILPVGFSRYLSGAGAVPKSVPL